MNRIVGLDLIRIIAIMQVVIYHYNANFDPIPFANDWGSFGVTLFFILSGYLLRVSYSKNPNLKNYFTKRFLSIFPLLWVTFIIFYIIHSINMSDFFYGGPLWKMIYSFLGFDGYLYSFFGDSNYFVIGEWFTGAILILYLIFPILNELLERNVIGGTLFIMILYFISVYFDNTSLTGDGKLFITIGTFWTGMLIEWIMERVDLKYYWLIPLTAIVVIVLSRHEWILYVPARLAMLASLFMIILIVTKDIHLKPLTIKILAYISDISFSVYLVHHVIIYFVMRNYGVLNDNPVMFAFLFVYTILVVFIIAAFLYWLTERLIHVFSYSVKNTKTKN